LANIFQPNSSSSSSSSGTGKNYLSTYNNNTGNGDFETGGTTGWSLAHSSLTSAFPSTVGTAGTAFSSAGGAGGGSAASGNLSLTASSSSPIAGTYTGVYASSAATTAGDMMISSAFTIDTEDQAKVLTFSFYYSATTNPSNGNWSGTSSNSFGVAIYDVTNALWIMPAGVWSMTQSTLAGYATGMFQTTSNSTQYQLAVFNANATSNSITVKFDDFLVGPQTKPFGPSVTDWTAYTPTGAWVSNSTYTGFWRRVGDQMEIRAKVATSGAPTSATLTVLIPTGYTIDTTKLVVSADDGRLGDGLANDSGSNYYPVVVDYSTTTAVTLKYITSTDVLAALTQAAPFTFGNGDSVNIFFKVPIVGWSSNLQMSNDTDTRVVAARMTGATATITGSYSDVTWTTVANDTHGAMGAISYTVPVTGYYDIMGAVDIGATSLSAAGGFFIGLNTGSVILENKFIFDLNVPENESLDFIYGSVFFNAGATFKLQIKTTGTVGTPVINSSATTNFLAIKRLSGPSVVAASESVVARYTFVGSATITNNSLSTLTSTNATLTKVKDSHSAMTTSGTITYTVPVAGTYRVSMRAAIAPASSTTGAMQNSIVQAGSASLTSTATTGFAQANATVNPEVTDLFNCIAGDTITFSVYQNNGSNIAISSSAAMNSISIERVGN
jgi:methionine-rich copper-binding protein CopC